MLLGVTKGPPQTLIYILTYKERLQLADTFPNRIWSFCPLADLTSSNYIHFEKYILFLSDLYIQRGARTHNPELKSRTLFQQGRPGAPVITYFEPSVNFLPFIFQQIFVLCVRQWGGVRKGRINPGVALLSAQVTSRDTVYSTGQSIL